MKTQRVLGIVAASILFISTFGDPAKAALSWDFGFVGDHHGFSGSGSFTLGGPNSDDGLTAFEYSGTCGQRSATKDNLCSFGLDDVKLAIWELEDDWTFSSLLIYADSAKRRLFTLALTPDLLYAGCWDFKKPKCNGYYYSAGLGSFHKETAYLTPVHQIPEPTSMALLFIGLLGLAGLVPSARSKAAR